MTDSIIDLNNGIENRNAMNLPNILTMSRIVMIPVFVVVFYLPMNWSYMGLSLIHI